MASTQAMQAFPDLDLVYKDGRLHCGKCEVVMAVISDGHGLVFLRHPASTLKEFACIGFGPELIYDGILR